MSIFFESHEITIYRNRQVGSSHRYSMSATGTVWAADLQPASKERTESLQGHFGYVYTAFVDIDCDVKEGDQIHCDGKVYSVKGVQPWRGAGLLDHLELLLTYQDG